MTKLCQYCHQEKALHDFSRWRNTPGNIGYRNTCKRCQWLIRQKLLMPLSTAPLAQGMKRCPQCKAIFPLEEFVPSPTKKYPHRRQHQCKKCTQRFWHERYIRLRAHYLAKEQSARAKDPDAYREKTKLRLNAKYASDPGHRAHVLDNTATRRALKRGVPITERVRIDVLIVRDHGICGLCHTPVARKDASVDHIIPISHGGEHSYRNTQLAHRGCNCRKGNRATIPSQLRMF